MTHMTHSFTNARLVLPESVITGSLEVKGGTIGAIDEGGIPAHGHDCEGDFLIPGLVELHTDHLEIHYSPRPKVRWNPVSAVQAHDAQIACAGITTVFDALRVGMDAEAELNVDDMRALAGAIESAQAEKRLRAEHFIHLRCEVSAPDVMSAYEHFKNDAHVRLMSLMDHTPGQRQFVSIEMYRVYYQTKKNFTDEQMETYIAMRQAVADKNAPQHRKLLADSARERGILLASHDDATVAHVDEAVSLGTGIAEFPTTLEAARASHAAGMGVLMGGPNVVRGGSHSGNISAKALAEDGCLDIISSDYVPVSMLQAAFHLAGEVEGISLPQAMAMVTATPAKMAGLADRGRLETGLRADLVQVRLVGNVPVVRGVWREGRRVA
ncbi:alpha-D-ribose 1-methylphosphonate 5-triphosphate diphosphatase [Pannonibacter sp. Pt2]|uniref:Alpha-D-ribose 1-methylphosphonate 5-triphosphate diphosphatase n=1 Tax=Pannonibacter anstelovis TaxID=3121537 RepID=A0ABU7ZQI7_9HYPH